MADRHDARREQLSLEAAAAAGCQGAKDLVATHTRFALVGGNRYVSVELDGCERVLDADNVMRQAGPDLVGLLQGR